MANTTIKLKKSGTSGNTPSTLEFGELSLNYADGKLYYKNASGVITYISSGATTNSFSTVNSNSSLILATSPLDTLSFVAGNNISISTDTFNKKITISSTASGTTSGGGPFVVSDDIFTGDGSTVAFTLTSTPSDVYSILVNINGVLQLTSSYSVATNVLTFTEAPSPGASIEVKTTNSVGANTITYSTALAQSAYDKANSANSLAQAAYNAANSAGSSTYVQAAFDKANTASANTITTQGVDAWQNTQITAVNNFAAGAYTQGNNAYSLAFAANDTANGANGLAAGAYNVANGANGLAQSAYNQANTNNSAITSLQGVDLTQNTNITSVNNYAASGYALANTNATNITAVNGYVASAYNQANVTIGVDATQNTRLQSIETINTNQNTSISIIQGVDNTQNTRLDGIEGTNLTQNNAITIIQGVDVTQNTRLDGIEGVNFTQNTNITSVNQYAASAYAKANTGGLFTGSVTIGQNLYVTGNLIVTGNVTSVSANDVIINDPIIYVANNNPGNVWDIGIAGNFTQGTYQHTGLVRDASDGTWRLFSNVVAEPTNTVDFTYAIYDDIRVGTVTGNVIANTVVVNGVNLRSVQDTQNTNITSVNQYAASGYALANTHTSQISVIQGVDTWQNNQIVLVNQFTQSAYDKANTGSVTLSDSVSSNSSTTAATSNAVLIAVSTALAYSIALG